MMRKILKIWPLSPKQKCFENSYTKRMWLLCTSIRNLQRKNTGMNVDLIIRIAGLTIQVISLVLRIREARNAKKEK